MAKPDYLLEAEAEDDRARAEREYEQLVAHRRDGESIVRKSAEADNVVHETTTRSEPASPFSDAQLDVLAEVIANLKDEIEELRRTVRAGDVASLHGKSHALAPRRAEGKRQVRRQSHRHSAELAEARMMRNIVVAALAQSARDMLVAERAFAEREVDRLRDEVEWLMRDRDRLLGALRELQSAVRARQKADAEVARLYRERDIARAWAVGRDPSAALN